MKVNFKDTEITATVHDDTSVYVNCNYLWSLLFWQLAQQTPLNNPQSPLIHSIIPNPCLPHSPLLPHSPQYPFPTLLLRQPLEPAEAPALF